MYVHWATTTSYPLGGDPASPGCCAWRYQLDSSLTAGGVTAYVLFKTHNIFGSPFGAHWTRFARGFGTFTPPSSDGQMDLDLAGVTSGNGSTQVYDAGTGQPGLQPTRTYLLSVSSTLHWAHSNNVLQDDTWFEMAYYVLPSSGNSTADGAVRVVSRPYGSPTWTTVMAGINDSTAYGTGRTDQFLIAPYVWVANGQRWTNDMRQYFATIRLYAGNAICNGTIDPSLTC